MAISIGTYVLPEQGVVFSEERGDIAGRDRRTIRVSGILDGFSSRAALEAALDAVLHAASTGGDATLLSLRPGRRLVVRRTGFARETDPSGQSGAFRLDFEAVEPSEEAVAPTMLAWPVSIAQPSQLVPAVGNQAAPLVVSFTSETTVYAPSATDGTRTISFTGSIYAGQTIVFDGVAGKGYLDGEEITPLLSGEFPQVAPPETSIAIGRALFGELAGAASVSFHARWW